MVEHDLHVLIAQAEVQDALGTFDFEFDLLLVEETNVIVKVVDVDFVEINSDHTLQEEVRQIWALTLLSILIQNI